MAKTEIIVSGVSVPTCYWPHPHTHSVNTDLLPLDLLLAELLSHVWTNHVHPVAGEVLLPNLWPLGAPFTNKILLFLFRCSCYPILVSRGGVLPGEAEWPLCVCVGGGVVTCNSSVYCLGGMHSTLQTSSRDRQVIEPDSKLILPVVCECP